MPQPATQLEGVIVTDQAGGGRAHLLEEDLRLLEDVLQLNEVQEVSLQSLFIGVDLLQLHL